MSNNETHFIKFLMILVILGLVSALSACSDYTSQYYRENQKDQILGGQPVKASSVFSQKVIYLALGVEWKTSSKGSTVIQTNQCSASAIAPRLLLTAAHCVKGYLPQQINAVLSLNPWNHHLNENEWIKVDTIKIHEDYVGTSKNFLNDIAIIRLSEDLSEEHITPIAKTGQTRDSIELISIGYGLTQTFQQSQAGKKAKDTLLNYVIKTVENFEADKSVFEIDQSDRSGICSGDSGGPGLIYDTEEKDFYILGIASYVYGHTSEGESIYDRTECLGRAGYTNVLPFTDWIERTVKELSL